MKTRNTILFALLVVFAGLGIFQMMGRSHLLRNELAGRETYFQMREQVLTRLSQVARELDLAVGEFQGNRAHTSLDLVRAHHESFVMLLSRAQTVLLPDQLLLKTLPPAGDVDRYERWLKGSDDLPQYLASSGSDGRSLQIFEHELFGTRVRPRKVEDYKEERIGDRRLEFLTYATATRRAMFGAGEEKTPEDSVHKGVASQEIMQVVREETTQLESASSEEFRGWVLAALIESLRQEIVAPSSRYRRLSLLTKAEGIRFVLEGHDPEMGVRGLGLLDLWSPADKEERLQQWNTRLESVRLWSAGAEEWTEEDLAGVIDGFVQILQGLRM